MKLISLRDFQNISNLSDRALLWLLVNQRLTCQCDQSGAIMIDADSLQVKELVKAISTRSAELVTAKMPVISERFANIVARRLDDILEQALAALRS